ncbi:MAG: lamin tail domain-containing protein [Planctomycetota bacterium]|nr:lamin tail domain-containing protein [Planctomycetota bacterium]
MAGVCGAASAASAAPRSNLEIEFPHPVISEVLFHVPPGNAGDANGDGSRDAAGDEFIEIVNPHDRPIPIGGYVLSDKPNSDGCAQLRFVFPPCRLEPGQCAVVFNGHRSTIPGPVGTDQAAPAGPNESFGGALVFTMGNASENAALGNGGDFVLLTAPDGTALDAVIWGFPSRVPPTETLRVMLAVPDPGGSVARRGAGGEITAHVFLDGRSFSPGVWLGEGGGEGQ